MTVSKDSEMKSAQQRLLGFARLVIQCQRQYGLLEGLRLALALRRAAKSSGLQHLVVPGLPGSVALRGGTSDVDVFIQIFLHHDLDFVLRENPVTIVDGGANIGLSSLYLAQKYPDSRIVAVEFEASNFALLKANVGAYERITCVHAGLWSDDGRLSVSNPQAQKWAYCPMAASHETAESESVPAITIGALLDRHAFARVDLLKLDIEGSEFEVLAGSEVWLARVKAIAIELHDWIKPGCGMRFVESIARRRFQLQTRGEYLLCEFDAEPSTAAHDVA